MQTSSPPRPARRRLSRSKKLLLSSVTCGTILLALEGAVRLRERLLYGTFARAGTTMFVPPARPAGSGPQPGVGVAPASSGGPASVSPDDALLLQPGLAVSGSRFQVHVNALGFRGPEIACPKPAGVKRIACVGGSTTFDIYAERDDLAWPALMENALRQRHPRVEVVNAGAGGRQLRHSLGPTTWKRTAEIEPDIVFVYHATNDITEACQHLPRPSTGAPRTIGSPSAGALKTITDWSLLAYKVWLLATSMSPPPEKEGPDGADVPDAAVAAFEGRLRDLVARSKALGARVALGTFALRWRPDQPLEVKRTLAEGAFTAYPGLSLAGIERAFRRYNEAIVRVARETDCLLVPVADELSGEPRWFGDVMHTTAEGSRKLAQVVGDALERARWLD